MYNLNPYADIVRFETSCIMHEGNKQGAFDGFPRQFEFSLDNRQLKDFLHRLGKFQRN